jgi:uncharacterized membrane protein YdjX (TVP38/TMEM64 family)
MSKTNHPRRPRSARSSRASGRGSSPEHARSKFPDAERKLRQRALIGFAIVAVVLVTLPYLVGFDWKALQTAITDLNSFLVFALMALLPVAGFSISIVYLIAGAKFGPVLGGVLVAAATAIHLLLTHWISRSFLRAPLQRMLTRKKYHLPEIPAGENGAISVMAALVPGPPYFIRNYLLALSGVPFRTYFWICLSIYVARSYVSIFIGDLSGDPSRSKLFLLVGIYVLKLGICAYLIARLRRRYKLRGAKRDHATSGKGSDAGKSREDLIPSA